jgi:hypothetical protein
MEREWKEEKGREEKGEVKGEVVKEMAGVMIIKKKKCKTHPISN